MEKLLTLLDKNPRLTNKQLAAIANMTEAEVSAAIEQYEADGIIRGYRALVDWDKTPIDYVEAIIELKVTPKRDHGYEELAKMIVGLDEVRNLYLMSGAYDFAVFVTGKTFKDIASFVARRLAPLDSVISTTTHFMLRRYKESGVNFCDAEKDERGNASL